MALYLGDGERVKIALDGLSCRCAVVKERPTFANASWTEIAEISESGQAAEYFKVGDEKVVPLIYADGTTENITVAIAGFNHDNLTNSSGKAGMTFVCMTAPTPTTTWRQNVYSLYYSSNYAPNTSLAHTLLVDTILPSLPDDLRAKLKTVTKIYDNSTSSGTNTTTSAGFKLWLLSLEELGLRSAFLDVEYYSRLGERYELFPEITNTYWNNQYFGASSFPNFRDVSGNNVSYYTRHIWRVGESQPMLVDASGYCTRITNNTTEGSLRFGFCV